MEKPQEKSENMRRFSPYRIIEHWVSALTFAVLVATGLSQRFHGAGLSQWIVLTLGGIDAVRLLHRAAGLVLFLIFFQHAVVAFFGVLFRKWRPSMIIEKKDFVDAVENMKYYLGVTDQPALCDRYNYKQKFEYWGILTGAIIMMLSGFVLWFPIIVTKYLPGEIIPAAKALHTNEAMLIVLLVTVWHIYNAIFSPDIFPLDTSIITGYISRERMESEHPLELARLEGRAAGDLSGESRHKEEDAVEAIDIQRERV
ncbi:MAG TPA: cytochrome b/b6 domain-containing protein [Thermodesulfovibrionales bacterium]|jgi:formate dehydrogenase gamma subunit|nr:cytochrome b/b6 domain-containing protein [Thermodesulfovibrionales bacterium]